MLDTIFVCSVVLLAISLLSKVEARMNEEKNQISRQRVIKEWELLYKSHQFFLSLKVNLEFDNCFFILFLSGGVNLAVKKVAKKHWLTQ
jgi:hypothetical protein